MLFLDLLADEEEEAALGHGFSLGFEGTSFPITTPCCFEPFGGEAERVFWFLFLWGSGSWLGLETLYGGAWMANQSSQRSSNQAPFHHVCLCESNHCCAPKCTQKIFKTQIQV